MSTAGIAAMIGPMNGTSSSRPAMIASRTAYRPNTGSTQVESAIRPMYDSTPTAAPSTSWPRTQLPNTRLAIANAARTSSRQLAGSEASSRAPSRARSLSRKNSQAGRMA